MQKRIQWIDALKGIGIIFVILGHSPISKRLYTYIYTFHMPLFFFISGYLFSLSRYKKTLDFIKSRIKSLLIPYFWFSLLSIIIYIFISFISQHKNYINLLSILKTFVMCKRNYVFYDVPLWFLTSLFTVEIIYYLLKKYIQNNFIILFILIILNYIEGAKIKTFGTALPWSFDASLFYIFFYGFANMIKETKNKIKYIDKLEIIVFSLCNIFTILFLLKINSTNYILSLIAAIIGIFTYISVAKLLSKSKILNYIGKNSLIYFALHQCISFIIINKCLFICRISLKVNNLNGILYTISAIVILIPIINIINRYCPLMLGKTFKSVL